MFIGKVREIVETRDVQRVTFDVEHVERGLTSPTIRIEQQGRSSCGFPFQTGQRYVVYAYHDDGRWFVGVCGRTALIADANEDLAYFRELKGPGSGGHIFGSVRQEEQDFAAAGTRDIAALNGLAIRLRGAGIERSVTTAEDGTYDFAGLLPGSYTLTLDAPKGMRIRPALFGVVNNIAPNSFGVELREPRGCFPISFKLREPGGSIRGVVVDEKGTALEAELVHIVVATSAGKSDGAPVLSTWTGPEGTFEFTDLSPGQYVIGTNLADPPEPTEFDRRAYLPGVRLPHEAAIITVDGARTVNAGTFKLPSDPVERTITGDVLWNDGGPATDAQVFVRGAIEVAVPVDTEGHFRVTLPYGAHFTLRATGRRAMNGRMGTSSTAPVEIGRNDRDRDVRLVLEAPQ